MSNFYSKTDIYAILDKMATNIQNERISQGLTREELAYQSDLSATTIERVENRSTSPTIVTIWKITQALGMNLNQLVQ